MRRRTKSLSAASAIVALLASYIVFLHTPAGPRSLRDFDPDRVAALEVGMWQAYYEKQNVRLFRLLVIMLREQYRYTWAKAATAGFYLARPAARFATMKGDYETVLPDLDRAFTMTKEWTGAGYDPAAVARAELTWWAARHDSATSAVDNVGSLIASTYAAFYEVPDARVATAGRLRAEVAALRDQGGQRADWKKVSELLHQSYRQLHDAVRPQISSSPDH